MQFIAHVDGDILEKYAMGQLVEADAEKVEDHIALCAACLDRLDETAAYVESMQEALKNKKPETRTAGAAFSRLAELRQWLRFPQPASLALAAVALLGVGLYVSRDHPRPVPVTVVIDGTRGSATVVHGAGPFDFQLFMPVSSLHYRVVLLNDAGRELWQSDAAGENGKLHARVDRQLAAGQYYLRVTDPVSRSVHDYGVRIAQ